MAKEKIVLIPLVAKVTAGWHPKYGEIVKGQTYMVDAARIPIRLFNKPKKSDLSDLSDKSDSSDQSDKK